MVFYLKENNLNLPTDVSAYVSFLLRFIGIRETFYHF